MNSPRILDAKGRELAVGCRVQSSYGPAEVVSVDFARDWPELRIETLASRRRVKFRLAYYTEDPAGYCADDLELLQSPDGAVA